MNEKMLLKTIKAQSELIAALIKDLDTYKFLYEEKCKEPARPEPVDRGIVYG